MRVARSITARSITARSLALAALCVLAGFAAGEGLARAEEPTARDKGGLVGFAPAGATSAATAPRRFGLFIGVRDFTRSGFPALRYADKDARDFAAAVEALDHRTVLTTPAETTRGAILRALKELGRLANRPLDTVLVYISSHGALARTPGGPLRRYVVTSDTQKERIAQTALPVATLLRTLERLRARRKAVVLAFCHSGAGKSVMTDDLASALWGMKGPFVPPPLEDVSEGTAVLSASAFGETAREDDRLQGDVYTHFLIEGIKSGDLDGDGAVTLTEAHDYARSRTYALTGGAQRPTALLSFLGADPFVLAGVRQRRPRPVLFSYAAAAEGLWVAVDGRVKGALPGSVVVEAGPRRVELRDGEAGAVVYAGEMDVREGERLDVVSLIPRIPAARLTLRTGVLSALDGGGRATLVPASVSFGLEGSLPLRLWPRWRLALALDYARGSGDAAGPAELRPSLTAGALSLAAALLAQASFGRWRLEGGPALALSWLRRTVSSGDASGESIDQGVGLVAAGRVGAGVDLGAHLALEAGLELGALLMSLGDTVRITPVIRFFVGLAVRF